MLIKLKNFWLLLRIFTTSVKYIICLATGSHWLKDPEKFIYPTVSEWGKKIIKIFKIKCSFLGRENIKFLPGRNYILMSNHTSFLDIPLIYAAFAGEKITMVAKKELFKIPLLKSGLRAVNSIKIDRQNVKQAMEDLKVVNQQMKQGIRVWIAPEGTRVSTAELGRFKKGGFKIAKETEAIIIPITIKGSRNVWPIGGLNFKTEQEVEVKVHIGIDSKNYELEELISKVRTAISD